MRRHLVLPGLTLALVLSGSPASAAPTPADEPAPIGVLKAVSFEKAKEQALNWLKETKANADAMKQAEVLWDTAQERLLLERVAETIILGDAAARDLIESARDPQAPAPTEVPEYLTDAKRSAYVRHNLGLYYAKQLANRRVYEETLATLKGIKPEQVVDPATFYFFKAVAEHKLQNKEAVQTIDRLLAQVTDLPERYQVIAMLMKLEMMGWKQDDLAWAARTMDDIARRFDLARGGKLNQDKQKEVIAMLDQLIKKMEQQQQQQQPGPPGPGGGNQNNTARPSNPANDAYNGGIAGSGDAQRRNIQKTADLWGKLPEKERVKAMEQLKREYPNYYKEAMEEYARLATQKPSK